MTNTDPIIKTKLHLPFTRSKLVLRPRLLKKITQGLQGPLTLVTAPAGFGKTTLVASAIIDCGMPVAWLSLDKNDNQEGHFLRYLVAALQETDHTIGSEAAQLMAGMQQASSEAILTSLINDLHDAEVEIALVLDDYQSIHSQAVHRELAFLLEHAPNTFHLVIATRSDPPLPLARLRARGQMLELRAADLRFTESEAAQFLNEIMGLCLETGLVAALEERTEGWIAGLQMAALSMRNREDLQEFIESFSGTNRYILDYLLEEVLVNQPLEIQYFLTYTSILERLTTPLCDFILAMEEISNPGGEGTSDLVSYSDRQSTSILEYLEQANLFLIPLDDERIWYRYHHIFADLLCARLHQAKPDLTARLHMRAATWFEQQGFIPEAIQHLSAAQELDRAAELIERYGPERWIENDPTVLQMADDLQYEMIVARPRLGLHQAWRLIIQGLIERVLPLLDNLAQKLAETALKSEQQWMQTVISLALAFLKPTRLGSDSFPDYKFVEQIPAEEPILRNAADFLYVMTLGRRGELDRAVKVSEQCIEREKTRPGTSAIPSLVPFLTRGYLMQGRLHAAAALCRARLDLAQEEESRFIDAAGNLKIDFGEVLSEWNRLDEAKQYIQEGLLDNEPWQNIMTDGFGWVALTRILLAQRDYAGAMQTVKEFETCMATPSRPREFEEDYRTLKVRTQLASGDLHKPTRWADRIQLGEDFDLHKEYYRLTLAHIWLAQGRYAEVEEWLTGTVPLAEVGSQITRELESNLLLAAAIAGQGRQVEALEIIKSCLALAEPEGYIRIFLDLGEPVRELLVTYLKSDAPDYALHAQKISKAFSSPKLEISSNESQPAGLIEPLTERELEILRIMFLGKTNKEIAQELIIAPGTVKAHAASIYRKLEVANRTEAVARARQLGILT